MKIFIPIDINNTGGIYTFARKFKEGMALAGHQVFFEFQDDYDILFIVVRCPLKYIWNAKRGKKKIIHRLDGAYYWSVSGIKYLLYNLKPRIIHKFFSDFTIYQSEYSKYVSEKFLGKRKNENYKIIYNGVNLEKFSPEKTLFIKSLRDNPKQKVFFTASAFRRNDQILPIIDALRIYKNKYGDNFKFIVAGSFSGETKEIPDRYLDFTQIKFIGNIKNSKLPLYEREADVFLFTHLNPPCPNNVIEAMACGLPICGVSDGAMNELIKEKENGLLTKTEGNYFWLKRKININEFADNLNYIVKNHKQMSESSRRIAEERFSLEIMVKNYANILNK